MSEDGELLALAIEAAQMAGALLLERVGRGAERSVSAKSSPTDLVSEADLAAEQAIRELLGARRPDDGFVGEEGGSETGTSGLSWVVDPLDGTVNFLFGIPQWCVSVAVRDQSQTIAGAVYDPNRDELFSASRHAPARLTGPDGTVELGAGAGPAARAHASGGEGEGAAGAAAAAGAAGAQGAAGAEGELAGAMIATGLSYDVAEREAQASVLARLIPRVRDIRRLGSAALDLTWTAAGRYDAYFERSVKPWDIAAGALICERAGLRLLALEPQGSLTPGILAARPGLAEVLHELVGGA